MMNLSLRAFRNAYSRGNNPFYVRLLFFISGRFRYFKTLFVLNTCICGANGRTHRLVVNTLAFRAFIRNDVVEVLGESSFGASINFIFFAASINRLIGAFRLAGAAVDAFFTDLQRHCANSSDIF